MTKFLPEEVLIEAIKAAQEAPTRLEACRRLGITKGKLDHRLREAQRRKVAQKPEFSVSLLPSYQFTAEEIIERKLKTFAKRKTAQDSRLLIPVKINIPGPIAILHMGDPHLDDDGTNIRLVMDHLETAGKTKGMFLSCVGDYLNNWRGKLAPLHAMQSTTQQEAWKLLEWFISKRKWLYLIGGNHDCFCGNEDPLQWITRGLGTIYEWHGARVALDFPNRQRHVINVRHNFPGSSIYNRVQGATRAIRFGGTDDLYINGHRHTWGHYEEENSVGGISHAIQVSAYKEVDDFPKQMGFQQVTLGAAVVTIHDPDAINPHERVRVEWGIEEAADRLTYIRKKRRA